MSILNSYILLTTSESVSYEVSIYNAYPDILWINFILIDVLILSLLLLNESKTLIILFFLNQLTLLLLPLFRGYFIYGRTDVLRHLGQVKDILLRGYTGNDNFYPVMHILVSELRIISNMPINVQTVLLPAFFWSMLLVWYFMFIFNFTHDINLGKLSIVIWMLFPLGHWHSVMVGNMFSYTFIFLILGVWFSFIRRSKKYLLITVLYLNLVFFHPLTSMYVLMIFVTFDLFNYASKSYKRNGYFMNGLGIIVTIIWTLWYLSFKKSRYVLRAFWFSIMGLVERGNPFLSLYISNVERYRLPILRVIKFFLYRYFGTMLVGSLALIFIVKLLSSTLKTKRNKKLLESNAVIFILFIFLFVVWTILNMFLKFVNFERSLRYVVAFSIPLTAIMISKIKGSGINRKGTMSIVLLFLLFSYFGTFTVHSSPLSGNLNNQVSASEYYGMGWWFVKGDDSLKAYDDARIPQYRFYEAWYGRENALRTENLFRKGQSLIPEHFGYEKYKLAGSLFSSSTYYILSRAVFEFYNATIGDRVNYWRWRPKELLRLRMDITVNILYSSRDVCIYQTIPYPREARYS